MLPTKMIQKDQFQRSHISFSVLLAEEKSAIFEFTAPPFYVFDATISLLFTATHVCTIFFVLVSLWVQPDNVNSSPECAYIPN